MRPPTEIQTKFIGYLVDGEKYFKRAYQKASGSANPRVCETMGSRLGRTPWIAAAVRKGIQDKLDLIEEREREIYKKQLAEIQLIQELEHEKATLEAQAEKLRTAPRDDSHLDIGSRYPTREEANHGTLKGTIPRSVSTRSVVRKELAYPWGNG